MWGGGGKIEKFSPQSQFIYDLVFIDDSQTSSTIQVVKVHIKRHGVFFPRYFAKPLFLREIIHDPESVSIGGL